MPTSSLEQPAPSLPWVDCDLHNTCLDRRSRELNDEKRPQAKHHRVVLAIPCAFTCTMMDLLPHAHMELGCFCTISKRANIGCLRGRSPHEVGRYFSCHFSCPALLRCSVPRPASYSAHAIGRCLQGKQFAVPLRGNPVVIDLAMAPAQYITMCVVNSHERLRSARRHGNHHAPATWQGVPGCCPPQSLGATFAKRTSTTTDWQAPLVAQPAMGATGLDP